MQFVNNFRAFAILLVVFVHAISSVNSGDSIYVKLLSVLLENCSIFFVFIAGYLFSVQSSEFQYGKFIKGKIKFVVVPYVFFSLPAILLYTINFREFGINGLEMQHYWLDMAWFNGLNTLYQVIFLLITGAHLGPFWFIPMILMIYAMSPLFIFSSQTKYFFIILIGLFCLGFYFGRPQSNENVFQALAYFSGPYFLGVLTHQKFRNYTMSKPLEVFLFLSLIIYAAIGLNFEINSRLDLALKTLIGVGLFFIMKNKMNYKNKWLSMFAKLSFFIYFTHGYFTGFFRTMNRAGLIPVSGLDGVLIVFTFIVLLTILTFIIFKLVLGNYSKKIIGI